MMKKKKPSSLPSEFHTHNLEHSIGLVHNYHPSFPRPFYDPMDWLTTKTKFLYLIKFSPEFCFFSFCRFRAAGGHYYWVSFHAPSYVLEYKSFCKFSIRCCFFFYYVHIIYILAIWMDGFSCNHHLYRAKRTIVIFFFLWPSGHHHHNHFMSDDDEHKRNTQIHTYFTHTHTLVLTQRHHHRNHPLMNRTATFLMSRFSKQSLV